MEQADGTYRGIFSIGLDDDLASPASATIVALDNEGLESAEVNLMRVEPLSSAAGELCDIFRAVYDCDRDAFEACLDPDTDGIGTCSAVSARAWSA